MLAESRRGWYELEIASSPTFVPPDGRQVPNPAAGKMDLDGERGVVRGYMPHDGDPLDVHYAFPDDALRTGTA